MRYLSLLILLGALHPGVPSAHVHDKNGPWVRVYNATRSDPPVNLDIVFDDAIVGSGVASRTLIGPFTPKDRKGGKISIRKQNSTEELLGLPVDTTENNHVVVVMGDTNQGLDYADLPMNIAPPSNGQPQLGLVSLIPKDVVGDDVDIYVMKADDDMGTRMPDVRSLAFKGSSTVTIAPGTYSIAITKAGAKDILFKSEPFTTKVLGRTAALLISGSSGNPRRVVIVNL